MKAEKELGKSKKLKEGQCRWSAGTRQWGDEVRATNKRQIMQGLVGAWAGSGIYSQGQWAAIGNLPLPPVSPFWVCLRDGCLVLCPCLGHADSWLSNSHYLSVVNS